MVDIQSVVVQEKLILAALMGMIPPLADSLAAENAALMGKQCFQFSRLEELLAERHHYFRPSTVKLALVDLGWSYRQITPSRHSRKIGVWMKGGKA